MKPIYWSVVVVVMVTSPSHRLSFGFRFDLLLRQKALRICPTAINNVLSVLLYLVMIWFGMIFKLSHTHTHTPTHPHTHMIDCGLYVTIWFLFHGMAELDTNSQATAVGNFVLSRRVYCRIVEIEVNSDLLLVDHVPDQLGRIVHSTLWKTGYKMIHTQLFTLIWYDVILLFILVPTVWVWSDKLQ